MKLFLISLLLGMVHFAQAQDAQTFELRIKDHRFIPEVLTVNANEKFKLTVKNEDPSSEEFESKTMAIEKFMGPQKTITVTLGPLKPGTYEFFGEFHQSTAKGQVIAK